MSAVRLDGLPPEFDPSELSARSSWDKLGGGGYGVVWKAYSARIDGPIAVKEAKDEATSGALLVELRELCKLRNHPNIVSVLGAYTEKGKLRICLEYFAHDLSEIRAVGAVQPVRAILMVARAVKHMHDHGRLHRDIKRNNVLISSGGDCVKLADFGLARDTGTASSSPGKKTAMESRDYLAPEVRTGEYGTPADIYSLGKMIISFVTARRQHFQDSPLGAEQLAVLEFGADYMTKRRPNERIPASTAVGLLESIPCPIVPKPRLKESSSVRQSVEDLAKMFGDVDLKDACKGEDWESSTITSELASLSAEANGDFVKLARLNEKLQNMHQNMGITMKKMTEVIKEKGICLKDCKEYGPGLRAALRRNKKLLIPRNEAKQFQFVKKCLTRV